MKQKVGEDNSKVSNDGTNAKTSITTSTTNATSRSKDNYIYDVGAVFVVIVRSLHLTRNLSRP